MRPVRPFAVLAVGLLTMPVLTGTGHALVSEDNFISRTTGDLATLCSAAPTDKLYTAAVNFCHGFGAGVYGALATAQQANPQSKRFGVPPNMTRNEAIAAFVSWSGGSPRRAALPVLDGIAAFLTESYPCPKTGSVRDWRY
jgi:hypothetical protein